MHYDKIWGGVFDKHFEYFMKKVVTVPFFFLLLLKKSLNTDAVIDLKILDFFKKIWYNISLIATF